MIDNGVFNDINELKEKTENLDKELKERYDIEMKKLEEKLQESENEKEKKDLMTEIKDLEKEYNESKELLDNMNNGLGLEESGIETTPTLRDAIARVEAKIQEDPQPEIYVQMLSILNDTLTLNRIKNKIISKSRNELKKNYKVWLPMVYEKLDKSKVFFPNVRRLKGSLKEIFKLTYPDMNEKKINDNSNILGSIILYYILNTKLDDEKLFIYYLLDNIIYLERLPIDDQIKLQANLLSLGSKFYK